MNWFWAFWGLLIGASLGSFLAAALWRSKNDLGLGGRSICSSCGEPIPGKWNIPLVSWPLLRGKARCCGAKLDKVDFLWEIVGAALGALAAFFLGPVGIGVVLMFVLLFVGTTKII